MEVTKKTRFQLRIQNITFVVLFLTGMSLLAWISNRYNLQMDWTATNRNTLSEASIALLQRIPGPVKVTAFATDSELVPVRKSIRELLARYQQHKDDLHLNFIDPNTEPDKTRAMEIRVDGELVIEYQGRTEHVQQLNEETLSNTLQRLLRGGSRSLTFLSGHGERAPSGRANHDLGSFFQELAKRGLKTTAQALSTKPEIPANSAALVIASPQVKYLDGEVKLIRDYVHKGGNLLWVMDPGDPSSLQDLAQDLGIALHAGTLVDPTTQLLGINDPSFAIVADYPNHPITRNFTYLTLFPRACALQRLEQDQKKSDWDVARFLTSAARSWSETGALAGSVEFDAGKDTMGPLSIGLALSREINRTDATATKQATDTKNEQRIVVLCDGDFFSNAYLGNQGNQKLAENIINWVGHDDTFIDIPIKAAPDKELVLSQTAGIIIAVIFLLLLPIALLAGGIRIWLKRRKQ